MKMKICKEEKALIKAYVNLLIKQGVELEEKDSAWVENECTKIIDNRNMDYRMMVDDFIVTLISK